MAFLKARRGFSGQKVGYSLEMRAESYAQAESRVARFLMLGNPLLTGIVRERSLVLWQKMSACVAGERAE